MTDWPVGQSPTEAHLQGNATVCRHSASLRLPYLLNLITTVSFCSVMAGFPKAYEVRRHHSAAFQQGHLPVSTGSVTADTGREVPLNQHQGCGTEEEVLTKLRYSRCSA